MAEEMQKRLIDLVHALSARSVFGSENEDFPFGEYDPLVQEARDIADALAAP